MRNVLNLSVKIKQARVRANLSQKDLAEKLGVSDKTISAYELGRAIPPSTTLKRISEITGQSLNGFFDDHQESDLETINKKLDIILRKIQELSKKHV